MGVGYRIIRGYYYLGANGETVAIMRGVQGSFFGLGLQQPYLLGCLNDRNELSQISDGQSASELGCELMLLKDLQPADRAQVAAGLPAGSLDNAIAQLRQLADSSLLPVCAPARTPATAAPRGTTSAPLTAVPAPRQVPGTDCRAAA
jgi:protein phosphatase